MTATTAMMPTTSTVRIFTLLVGASDCSVRRSAAAMGRFCYTRTYASDVDIRAAVAFQARRGAAAWHVSSSGDLSASAPRPEDEFVALTCLLITIVVPAIGASALDAVSGA